MPDSPGSAGMARFPSVRSRLDEADPIYRRLRRSTIAKITFQEDITEVY